MPQLGQGGWAMAGKSQRQRLPGSCNSAGRVGHQALGGDKQPPPLPLAPPAPGRWAPPLQHAGTLLPQTPRARVAGTSCCRQLQRGAQHACWALGMPQPWLAARILPGPQRAGDPQLCGLSTQPQPPGPSWPPPARQCREPQGGPLPYLTPCSQPFPALPWLAARQHSGLPSLIARWLIVIPWCWTPIGVGCQG